MSSKKQLFDIDVICLILCIITTIIAFVFDKLYIALYLWVLLWVMDVIRYLYVLIIKWNNKKSSRWNLLTT